MENFRKESPKENTLLLTEALRVAKLLKARDFTRVHYDYIIKHHSDEFAYKIWQTLFKNGWAKREKGRIILTTRGRDV